MNEQAKLNITSGPWKYSPWHIEEGEPAVRSPDGWIICTTSSDENAAFIAEAGTVAHETGLTPRQLAEQRKELMKALQGMLDNACAASDVLADGSCRIDCTQDEWDDHVRACGVARAALAKAEGRS
jgi:hypothetical protein